MSYPLLRQLAGAYFHQDYDSFYETAEQAVRQFVLDSNETNRAELLTEIQSAMSGAENDSALMALWVDGLDSYYEPDGDGLTARQWFERMAELVRERL